MMKNQQGYVRIMSQKCIMTSDLVKVTQCSTCKYFNDLRYKEGYCTVKLPNLTDSYKYVSLDKFRFPVVKQTDTCKYFREIKDEN